MADSVQRVKLTIEYDMEVFNDDPADVYILCDQELQFLENNDTFINFPDDAEYTLTPILKAGS